MRTLFELITAPPSISDRGLMLHLVAKGLILTTVLILLWVTQAQASVVYEAF